MNHCFFVSDLHGRSDRYLKLLHAVRQERPRAVFLGGDLLPSGLGAGYATDPRYPDFLRDYLIPEFRLLQSELGTAYPAVFIILGNDDPKGEEPAFEEESVRGTWTYVHNRSAAFGSRRVYGYANVPPTPFRHKDWERYDVSRYVPPGAVSPEEGYRSVPVAPHLIRYATIQEDLELLAAGDDLERAIFLFHTPPHETPLDRAALDGKSVDHVPLDLHVGSIAVRRFVERHQPLLTLHGHIHESTRLTGAWRGRLGRSHAFGAAHDGPELALVRFDPEALEKATRHLI